MYHAGGLTVFMTPLFAIGGSIVLHDGFDAAEFLRALLEYECTLLFGVPIDLQNVSRFSRIRSSRFEPPALVRQRRRSASITASPGLPGARTGLSPRLWADRGRRELLCHERRQDSLRKAGSIGKPMMFTEAKLLGLRDNDPSGSQVATNTNEGGELEVGELCLRGPHVCRGYWNNPTATAKVLDRDGWFHTGDLARCDKDGFFYIAGRFKDMIISGGVNIYPAEIEKELLDHPAVAEVSVMGTTDEKWGEVPVAFVALKPGASTSDLELIEFLRSRISKIKLPRQVIFVEALPRNAYGKVLKLELQDRLRNLKSNLTGGHDTVTPGRKSS